MYLICKAMEWAHLPMAGGLYDQDPKFLDDVMTLMEIEGEQMKLKQARDARKNKPKGGMSRRGGRR